VLCPLKTVHPVFQWHHWGFDCPHHADSIAESPASGCQAFRIDRRAWGFQFHLELDRRLIHRWLTLPFYREDLAESGLDRTPESIEAGTGRHLPATLELADRGFGNWLDLLGAPEQRVVLGSA